MNLIWSVTFLSSDTFRPASIAKPPGCFSEQTKLDLPIQSNTAVPARSTKTSLKITGGEEKM